MFLVFGRVEFVRAGDGKVLQKVGTRIAADFVKSCLRAGESEWNSALVPYGILSEERERERERGT